MKEGVRTTGAKRLIRRSIRRAKKGGHSPVLVCRAGYMELYACKNKGCNMTFDCWDSPEICNGPMPRARCQSIEAFVWKRSGNRRFVTSIADSSRRMINIFSWFLGLIKKFFSNTHY